MIQFLELLKKKLKNKLKEMKRLKMRKKKLRKTQEKEKMAEKAKRNLIKLIILGQKLMDNQNHYHSGIANSRKLKKETTALKRMEVKMLTTKLFLC